ncbi:C2H2-type zinc finger protein [Aspergillus stella-maris]|uniref:C2H2-type zinc finger protein n=1 Tax=Aspergillus stella-maris TaxID=1810926 RepID=UPI003CCD752C
MDDQVKPFSCSACNGRFTRQENLTRHIASVHRRSNLRPFPCPQCDVSFSRSDLRKRHIRKYHLQETSPPTIKVTENAKPLVTPKPLSTPNGSISWLFKLPLFISAYFQKFQTIFPIIHQPTFDTASTQEPLLQAVACIGAVYHSAGEHHEISVALMQSGLQSLDLYVEKNGCAGFREIWVVQAYVLFAYFALHSCDDTLFATALSIHRKLVDAARQYQLLQDNTMLGQPDLESLVVGVSVEQDWRLAIRSEARKRAMYSLYYLDAQMSVCCNLRPLLNALELKYELPCADDLWSAPTATAWQVLILAQDDSLLNERDDDAANADPRPAEGDLYSSLMYLMSPSEPGKRLGLLWASPFAALMLVMQIQMMVRDLVLGSTFLYHNIRGADADRHTLSIISEPGRAQVMQALDALAELMPSQAAQQSSIATTSSYPVDPRIWNHVWVAWHYTALSLTHQDGLLTNGIVEYSLPTAISTAWELGKPRAKPLRDVYEDRDLIRVTASLENILRLLTRSGLSGNADRDAGAEDPFTTMLGFKACLIGWRTVRLLALTLGCQENVGSSGSVYALSAKVLMHKILESASLGGHGGQYRRGSVGSGDTPHSISSFAILNDSESQYLERVERVLSGRNTWPAAAWIGAVFTETKTYGGGSGQV